MNAKDEVRIGERGLSLKVVLAIFAVFLTVHTGIVVPSILYAASKDTDDRVARHAGQPHHSGAVGRREIEGQLESISARVIGLESQIRELRALVIELSRRDG